MLGGAQSLHTNSRDEALALPTEEAARLALRTQQIIAYEAGVTETPDPLAGSYYVESLTNELEAAAWAYLDEIESMGGTLVAIERGFQQREIQEAAYRVQRAIESNDQIVVGVNKFRDDEIATPPLQKIDPDGERRQIERVRRVRAERSADGWERDDRRAGTRRGRGGQPDAGHPRRRAGARHGRRDQRPPARRVGRASRADHGLTPNGIDQRRTQRASWTCAHRSRRSATAANGPTRPRLELDRRQWRGGRLSDGQVVDDLVEDAAVGRMVAAIAVTAPPSSPGTGVGSSGSIQTTPSNRRTRSKRVTKGSASAAIATRSVRTSSVRTRPGRTGRAPSHAGWRQGWQRGPSGPGARQARMG